MHALVDISPFWGGSGVLHLYLLVCRFPRVTLLKSFSLHLYTFIQFQIRFKTCLHDLKPH